MITLTMKFNVVWLSKILKYQILPWVNNTCDYLSMKIEMTLQAQNECMCAKMRGALL